MNRKAEEMMKRLRNRLLMWCICCAAVASVLLPAHEARAEFGDIVMNNTSEASNIEPVVFPHWFHRIRYTCKACHADLGIKFKTGVNQINMVKIMDGQYCGACHDGNIAWSTESCDLCHNGKKGGSPAAGHQAANPSKAK